MKNLQKSLTLFETFRTVDEGQGYLWLDEHFARIEKTVSQSERKQLSPIKKQLQSLLPFDADKRIRLIVDQEDVRYEIQPLNTLPELVYQQGVVVRDVVFERPNPSLKYETDVYAQYAPGPKDTWFETIFVDSDGFVREGNITNVFFVIDDVLVTPPVSQCLPGIARANVLEQVRRTPQKIEERPITKTEALTASSMFLTNSVKGVIPVKKWGKKEFTLSPPLLLL